jgi:hypothetical protein
MAELEAFHVPPIDCCKMCRSFEYSTHFFGKVEKHFLSGNVGSFLSEFYKQIALLRLMQFTSSELFS